MRRISAAKKRKVIKAIRRIVRGSRRRRRR